MSLRFWLAVGLVDLVTAANIFVSHYTGTVQSLTLKESGGGYTLVSNGSVNVGGQPSWMTYDRDTRTIYNTDETGFGSGILTAVSAAPGGGMSLSGKATGVMLGGVHSTLYGPGYLAVAHYQTSSITTYKLPLSSSLRVQETLTFRMNSPGKIPSRQDAPHPHSVFPDPTGNFLLSPDLGADQIRIYSINKSTGRLTACASYISQPGSGPRHGTFYGDNILYVGNELSNTVHKLSVTYPSGGCLKLGFQQSLTTIANNRTLPSGSKVGEVHTQDNFLYVSNRRDLSFPPNDSIASFSLDEMGNMKFQQITSSGGTYPRTFAINKAGDFIVIGDQTTANVVVAKRDPATGLIGAQVASMRIGSTGRPENDDGLSAVLWDD
ncbi:Lactonase, 7-bladed beta-propeller-domain-containing protein [Amylocarpus encephaloides]|uniref:Lactonase, 7-bladed beta-propeller-domain-containing protein n=1 Tax=Amylocarpus encephaloides TaxID=45428 RepID=A0A9P7YT35_9HELO|nr:Lactonase, 7-bladed beta-propeller-domain-containing protein [Amylocarpus encephaloides]